MRQTSLQVIIGCVAAACMTLGAVTPEEQESFNRAFGSLGGRTLRVEEIVPGMKIPLHSIIRTKPVLRGPDSEDLTSVIAVTVAFPRELVDQLFLESFLKMPKNFPFGDPGVETVVTKDRLEVTIRKGVTFHLRNDVGDVPTIKAFVSKVFVSEDVEGVVTEVRGRAFVSRDTQVIRKQLSWFWSSLEIDYVRCSMAKDCFEDAVVIE